MVTMNKTLTLTEHQLAKLRGVAEHPFTCWDVDTKTWVHIGASFYTLIPYCSLFTEWGLIVSNDSGFYDLTDKARLLFTNLQPPPPFPEGEPKGSHWRLHTIKW